MTVQQDSNHVLQLVKTFKEGQIFHQQCGEKPEQTQIIDDIFESGPMSTQWKFLDSPASKMYIRLKLSLV